MMDELKLFGAASDCAKNLFFGIPNWSTGLHFDSSCNVSQFSLGDIWLIVANVVREALAVAGLLAVIFIIIGGFMFITSAGNPEQVTRARGILTNAIIGLIIAIVASAIVGFIAGIF